MCAIEATTVKQSEAQFCSRWSGLVALSTSSGPSTSTPSSSAGGVTLDATNGIASLQRCFDTLSAELYQVNTCVDHIARRQAHLGGFVESPSPPSEASKASEDDDDSNNDDDDGDGDGDGDVSSSSSDEMST